MRLRSGLSFLSLVAATSCTGTTGSALVSFSAFAAGPADASETGDYVFTSGRGWEVTLDTAVLHVGGVYLNRAVPVSGAQATSCILPALYVAEVSGGMDIDVISPRLQAFPVRGQGTETRASSGELWLTSGDVNAVDDEAPIVRLHGWAEKDGDIREIAATLTIGKNRAVAPADPSQPGASPLCKQRIVSPLPIDITPETGGSLLLRVDPRGWFADVDFSSLLPDDAGVYHFLDQSQEQPSVSLYQGIHASDGVYSMAWVPDAHADPSGTFQHGGGAGGMSSASGGAAGTSSDASFALPCPTEPGDVYAPATLASFSPPVDPGPGGVLFDVSGEVLAASGYAFPPASPDDPAFVDGWQLEITRLIVTLDRITLSDTPDRDPGDPSKTGDMVAEVDGPFAVDLHPLGSLAGKGGAGETAIPLAAISSQNRNGDAPFDPSLRYAFGFDTVAATTSARNVNLDQAGLTDYAEMIARGYSVLYVGTATFRGVACTPDDAEFSRLPRVVNFRLGFASPTSYANCQNPDNDPSAPLPGEEHERGIATRENSSVVTQMTIHTDHPFWDSVVHDSPAHFDAIAAQYTCVPPGTTPTARVEDLAGVDFLGFRDREGHKLPWRSCVGSAFVPPDRGTMHFDPRGLPVDPSSTDGTRLRDYRDYVVYNQSTQGHLDSDGLCYVGRRFPSPRRGPGAGH